ncbi:MAG: S-layer homology domain-containing protein [Oscillospiraceae bacterium]|nr:S-layer homology domain-containing protein [Oscillospiraceae bacterium]
MKQRIISALLAMVLCVGLMPGALAAEEYSDVPAGHWAAENISRATELGIFNGVGDGLFGCGQEISRAAFVTALVRMFGWTSVTPKQNTFADVTSDRWYYSAVETAVANDAVATASNTFRPNEALKRGEMAAMLMRALGYTSLAGMVSNYSCPFSDVTVNRGFITMAYDMGIVSGMGDGIFSPDTCATREQAATILVRLYDRLHAENIKLSDAVGRETVFVETPTAQEDSELPETPLEPIAQLYDALRAAKESGQDMSKLVLLLTAGGVRTIVSDSGDIVSSETVTADQVKRILTMPDVRIYYSQRYESAYCVYLPNFYQTVTMWYQSEESLAVKLQLARMFGVVHYVLK